MRTIHIRFAVWASMLGVPLPQVLDALRRLLGIKCSKCAIANEILRDIIALGDERALEMLKRLMAGDEETAKQVKKEFDGYRRSSRT